MPLWGALEACLLEDLEEKAVREPVGSDSEVLALRLVLQLLPLVDFPAKYSLHFERIRVRNSSEGLGIFLFRQSRAASIDSQH